jgi:hypothetical protein
MSIENLDEMPLSSQMRDQFQVTLTQSTDDALNFLYGAVSPANPFSVDRLWSAPTNRLAGEINKRIHEWPDNGTRDLGRLQALIHLISPCRSNTETR